MDAAAAQGKEKLTNSNVASSCYFISCMHVGSQGIPGMLHVGFGISTRYSEAEQPWHIVLLETRRPIKWGMLHFLDVALAPPVGIAATRRKVELPAQATEHPHVPLWTPSQSIPEVEDHNSEPREVLTSEVKC